MADIPSALAKFNDVEISSDAPVTEALQAKMGGNINFFADHLASEAARKDCLLIPFAATSFTTAGSTTTIATATLTVGADDVVRLEIPASVTASASGTANPATAATFRLRRGSTAIRDVTISQGGTVTLSGSVFDKPGAGNHVYTFECIRTGLSVAVAITSSSALFQTIRA